VVTAPKIKKNVVVEKKPVSNIKKPVSGIKKKTVEPKSIVVKNAADFDLLDLNMLSTDESKNMNLAFENNDVDLVSQALGQVNIMNNSKSSSSSSTSEQMLFDMPEPQVVVQQQPTMWSPQPSREGAVPFYAGQQQQMMYPPQMIPYGYPYGYPPQQYAGPIPMMYLPMQYPPQQQQAPANNNMEQPRVAPYPVMYPSYQQLPQQQQSPMVIPQKDNSRIVITPATTIPIEQQQQQEEEEVVISHEGQQKAINPLPMIDSQTGRRKYTESVLPSPEELGLENFGPVMIRNEERPSEPIQYSTSFVPQVSAPSIQKFPVVTRKESEGISTVPTNFVKMENQSFGGQKLMAVSNDIPVVENGDDDDDMFAENHNPFA